MADVNQVQGYHVSKEVKFESAACKSQAPTAYSKYPADVL
jgi:hypothetical protein